MSTSAKDLRETLTAHCKNERHCTYAETSYWLSQYKDLARRAVQHAEALTSKLQEQAQPVHRMPPERAAEDRELAVLERNARRYLALREHGILLRQEAVVFDVTDLDAAVDRLLEGVE